jgi:hypothetical protein
MVATATIGKEPERNSDLLRLAPLYHLSGDSGKEYVSSSRSNATACELVDSWEGKAEGRNNVGVLPNISQ